MDKGYEKLDVFKLSRELAIRVHEMSMTLPKFEMYEEGSQIRRSAKSVPGNIVEGYCLRRHPNEFLQYLHCALASCEETRLHLGVLFGTKSLPDRALYQQLSSEYDRLGKMLFRFIESASSDHLPPSYVKEPDSPYETQNPSLSYPISHISNPGRGLKNLLLKTSNRVALVTINRPYKLNALNAETKGELLEVFNNIKSDPSIDIVILTGSGEKSFVAGTDIGELTELNATSGKEFSEKGQELFNLIENLGKPVIAAVNGYALGGGCELALACHLRISAENAKLGQPEVNLGIIPGYGGTQRLARLIGKGRAMEMILTGNQISAEEALRIGLVNKVVPQKELLSTAEKVAATILSKGQIAIRLTLKAVNMTEETTQSDGQALEATLFGVCCGTEDFKEGTRAFLEKRKPEFKNK